MKKFFTLIAVALASTTMMAQDEVEWGPNINSNSGFEGDDFTYVAAKPSLLNGEANGDIFSGEDVAKCVVEGAGVDGSKGLVITSAANPSQPWDAQVWITLPADVEVGEKIYISFDYRADWEEEGVETLSVGTQGHTTPGQYLDNNGIGNVDYTKEWNTFEGTFSPSSGQLSIAFNLSVNGGYDVKFYMDNLVVKREKADETLVPYWKNVVNNGDFEGENNSNYIVRIYNTGGDVNANPEEGIGMDGSRGIKIVIPAKASQTWDSQFFIKMNESIPAGDMIKVSFDYRAEESMSNAVETQAHGASAGSYNHYQCIGNPQFTNEWQHYEYTLAVAENMTKANGEGDVNNNPFQHIAFNLAVDDVERTIYFDNIVVKHKMMVPIDQNPAAMEFVAYLEELKGTYGDGTNFNLAAYVSNAAIRDEFDAALVAAMSLAGDDIEYEAEIESLRAIASKFASSIKDYANLNNYIALINEKAGQTKASYSELSSQLEEMASSLQTQYEEGVWGKDEIAAAIDNKKIYDMVDTYIMANIKVGDDVTGLIKNANYAWGTANWAGSFTARANSAEKWHATFDVNQTIANMPKGAYTLKFQGFQRHDTNDAGEVGEQDAVVYANANNQYLIECGDDAEVVPNSMESARAAFDQGIFANEFSFALSEAGDIKLGVKGSNLLNWVIWSDFQLIYVGADKTVMAEAINNQIAATDAVEQAFEGNEEGCLLNNETIEKEAAVVLAATKVAEGIATASQEDIDNALTSLVAMINEMNEVSKAVQTVMNAYTDYVDATDVYYDDATKAAKDRVDAVNKILDVEGGYLNLTTAELKPFAEEMVTLTSLIKINAKAYDATDENPFDFTYLFGDADFEDYAEVGPNANYPGWSGSGFGTGGGTAGPVGERWNQASGFDTYTTFKFLPEGAYELSCDGAYRIGGNVGSADEAIVNGEENEQAAYLYAIGDGRKREAALHNIFEGKMNEEEILKVMDREDIADVADCDKYTSEEVTYYFPNQLATADMFIQAGKFKDNKISFYVGADGEATVGIVRYKGQGNNWCFVDNFKLTYFGKDSKLDTAVKTVQTVEASKAIYTISGVRVNSAVKPGLYIVNGKKIVVK